MKLTKIAAVLVGAAVLAAVLPAAAAHRLNYFGQCGDGYPASGHAYVHGAIEVDGQDSPPNASFLARAHAYADPACGRPGAVGVLRIQIDRVALLDAVTGFAYAHTTPVNHANTDLAVQTTSVVTPCGRLVRPVMNVSWRAKDGALLSAVFYGPDIDRCALTPPPVCAPGQVSESAQAVQPGAIHTAAELHVANTSGVACSLTGYPTVWVEDTGGRIVLTAHHTPYGWFGGLHANMPAPTVVLPPGGHATAIVETLGVSFPSGTPCSTQPLLGVVLPGSGEERRFNFGAWPACSAPSVHPYVAGDTGQVTGP